MTTITTTDVTNGTLTDATVMNANFGAIKTVVNGNLDNANIASNAAIALSKLGQGGATTGQAIVWNGSAWAPGGSATPATSLPGSPTDGQQTILTDSLTAPTYSWLLEYSSGISGSYKWRYIGGTPAVSLVATAEATSSTTYAALATAGPSFTVPVAGDYYITISCIGSSAGEAQDLVYMSFDIGATAATDTWAGYCRGGDYNNLLRVYKASAVAASTALVSKYRSAAAASKTFANRRLEVRPILVG